MQPTITVSFEDILNGRAYIRLPFVSKVLLLHWAGAPWSNKRPDAFLHALQGETLARRDRTKIVHGGSRLGKSVLGGGECVLEAVLPGTNWAVISQRYVHVAREFQYVYSGMQELFPAGAFDRLRFKHTQNYHEYDCQTIWGSVGQGYSVESDEGTALLGMELSYACLGEGSHISTRILETRIMRAVDGSLMGEQDTGRAKKETGKLSIFTTPKGDLGCSSYLVEEVDKKTRGKPEESEFGRVDYAESIWIREADVLENPDYDRSVYEARKRTMSADAFAEQYEGKTVRRSGLVLHNYLPALHDVSITHEQVREMRLVVGVDTGAYTAMSLVGMDRNFKRYILAETYTEQKTLEETVEEFVDEVVLGYLGLVFGSGSVPALVDRIEEFAPDPASQHKLELLSAFEKRGADIILGSPRAADGGKLYLLPSLEEMNNLFLTNELYLNKELDHTPAHMRNYVWKKLKQINRSAKGDAPVKEPVKQDDHTIDAARLALSLLHHLGPLEVVEIDNSTFAEAWQAEQQAVLTGGLRDILREAEETPGGITI